MSDKNAERVIAVLIGACAWALVVALVATVQTAASGGIPVSLAVALCPVLLVGVCAMVLAARGIWRGALNVE